MQGSNPRQKLQRIVIELAYLHMPQTCDSKWQIAGAQLQYVHRNALCQPLENSISEISITIAKQKKPAISRCQLSSGKESENCNQNSISCKCKYYLLSPKRHSWPASLNRTKTGSTLCINKHLIGSKRGRARASGLVCKSERERGSASNNIWLGFIDNFCWLSLQL